MSGSTAPAGNDDYGEDLLYSMACKCEQLFDTPFSGAAADKWQELRQRFAIWTSYMGVFARKSQCLDARLRKAPDIKDLVARLLDILLRSLDDVTKSYLLPHDSSLEQCQISSGLANADSALTRINHLSIDIKQASRGSIDTKVSRFASKVDLAPFVAVAQAAVSSLYPGAHELLKARLRDTMAEVYSRILFLRDRQKQLQPARHPARPAFQSALQAISEDHPVETGASDSSRMIPPQMSIPAGQSIQKPTPGLDTARSQVSTSRSRPSTLDTQQMRSRKVATQTDRALPTTRKPVSSIQIKHADYPRPQISCTEQSLKCQWCSKHFEKETSESDWRRHVDEDLKPYRCMAERCPDPHACFTSFDGWFKHMQSHGQRWHQKIFPSPGWVCPVCDSGDVYNNPQCLRSHMEGSHGGKFTESQLQSVLRQSIMERPRPPKECPLCCCAVDEEPGTSSTGRSKSPKRQKEQMREESSKMARMTLEMRHPNPHHTSASQILDTSSSDSDASSVHRARGTGNGDYAKVIARHVAAHLQLLMALAIRLSSLPDGDFKSDGDEANSHSVDIGDSEISSDSDGAGTRLSASATDADMADADVADMVNDTQETPEAVIDLSHIPRQYDELDAKDDVFFQQLVRSGAFKPTGSMGDVDRAVDHDAPALGPKTGLTPLAAAVVSGNADEVQQLLEKGADPNERSLNGETPLLLAAWKAAREAPLITQLLLSKLSRDSVDDTCDAAENKTPLMCAIERAAASKSSLDLEVIRLLRSAGASLAIRNNDGFNATEVAKGLKVGATSIVRMKAIFRALHPESERSSLATLNSVVVSFLLFVVGAVNNLSDGAVDRLSGVTTKVDPVIKEQVNKTTEVQTAQQFIKNVDDYVKRNPVFATFFGKDNEDFIQELARKLVDLAKDSTSALGQPGVLPNTTQLTLYQQVIYYDDNSSTQKTKWWKHQEKLALGIAQITTRLLPDGEGVALRATNQGPSTDNYYILNLEALGEAMDSMRWKSYGSLDMGTNMKSYGSLDMGTNMKSGILQPLVYDKLAAGTLKRPLLVSIVTDGDCGPEGKDDSLANAILECGNRLVEAKYPRDSVKFVIGQVGSGRRATQFLESLRSNDKIAEVAYIVSEKVDEKFAEFNDNYWSLDRWLVMTLFEKMDPKNSLKKMQ